MKSFEDQIILDIDEIVVVDEYVKFQDIKRDFEVNHAYRSGYWNCFRPTKELIDHLDTHKIKYHLTLR